VEVIPGNRVIEVRAAGIHKGTYVRALLDSHPADAFVLCAGDDSTDLDMYRVLPEHAVCLHVGAAGAGRGFTLESPARMREVLQALLATAGASGRGS
jgi:trehalose 6-phosphate synthase/phosphatase